MSAAVCPASARLLPFLPLPSTPRQPPLATARRRRGSSVRLAAARREAASPPSPADAADCVDTGSDVECFSDTGAGPLLPVPGTPAGGEQQGGKGEEAVAEDVSPASLALAGGRLLEWASLVSPFFFWGTAMVAMKGVIPRTGPFFVAALRLLPAGALLVAFAGSRGRKQPSGWDAWFAVAAFGLIDAACFQGFLAEGLQKTSAGLGSVIIDSQPLTVAVLASLLFGESIGAIGVGGLVLGVVGLLLLELCFRFQRYQLMEMTQQSGEAGNGGCSSLLKAWPLELLWSAGCQSIQIQSWRQDGYAMDKMNGHSLYFFPLCFIAFGQLFFIIGNRLCMLLELKS